MTELVVYAGSGDGEIESYSGSSYETALVGGGTVIATTNGTAGLCGQYLSGAADLYALYFSFYFADLPAGAVVASPVLSLCLHEDNTAKEVVFQARQLTWSGGGLTSADWVDPRTLDDGGYTLLATLDSTGWGSTGAYKDFSSQAALAAAITPGGTLEMIVVTDLMVSGTGPPTSTREDARFRMADYSGTASDPKITLQYTIPDLSPLLAIGIPFA